MRAKGEADSGEWGAPAAKAGGGKRLTRRAPLRLGPEKEAFAGERNLRIKGFRGALATRKQHIADLKEMHKKYFTEAWLNGERVGDCTGKQEVFGT